RSAPAQCQELSQVECRAGEEYLSEAAGETNMLLDFLEVKSGFLDTRNAGQAQDVGDISRSELKARLARVMIIKDGQDTFLAQVRKEAQDFGPAGIRAADVFNEDACRAQVSGLTKLGASAI